MGTPLKDVGLRVGTLGLGLPLGAQAEHVKRGIGMADRPLTTQERAAYDVLRYSQRRGIQALWHRIGPRFYRALNADFRPKSLTHLRYDSLDISFTNAGSYKRAVRTGRHVEPLGKIFASSKMLPSKATLPDAMMRARYPDQKASSEGSRRSREEEAAPRWPCAAHFERPKSGQSLGAKRHKKLAKALSAATMKRLRLRPETLLDILKSSNIINRIIIIYIINRVEY